MSPSTSRLRVAPASSSSLRTSSRSIGGCGWLRRGGRLDRRVQRRALLERTPERLDQGGEVAGRHLLAVGRSGGAGDVLVHQRAAEVVAAGLQELGAGDRPELDPREL